MHSPLGQQVRLLVTPPVFAEQFVHGGLNCFRVVWKFLVVIHIHGIRRNDKSDCTEECQATTHQLGLFAGGNSKQGKHHEAGNRNPQGRVFGMLADDVHQLLEKQPHPIDNERVKHNAHDQCYANQRSDSRGEVGRT